jgi:hypothetical protein
MVYHGRVKGGVIVPDPPAFLPEGTQVTIEVQGQEDEAGGTTSLPTTTKPPFAGLLRVAGQAPGLPSDAARNYKHYLYGTAKEDAADRP